MLFRTSIAQPRLSRTSRLSRISRLSRLFASKYRQDLQHHPFCNIMTIEDLPITTRVGAVQAEPAWLDLDAGVEKVCTLIQEAADKGCEIVGFPVSKRDLRALFDTEFVWPFPGSLRPWISSLPLRRSSRCSMGTEIPEEFDRTRIASVQ